MPYRYYEAPPQYLETQQPHLERNWHEFPYLVLAKLQTTGYNDAVRYASMVTKDQALAEDAVQKALVEIWPRIQTGAFGNNPDEIMRRTWSYFKTIVYARACDLMRPRRREVTNTVSRLIEPDSNETLGGWAYDLVQIQMKAAYEIEDDSLDNAESFSEEAFLKQLGLPQDEVWLLVQASVGADYEDIAIQLGVPVGTVKSRLSRLRARLRNLLAGTEFERKPKSSNGRHE